MQLCAGIQVEQAESKKEIRVQKNEDMKNKVVNVTRKSVES